MRVKLTILNPDGPGLPAEHEFDAIGGTIGRGADADWALPDPDNLLSRRHCEISFDGQFVVTDTSSNGVYLNGAAEPVGRGNSQALRDGDRLTLGPYEIAVAITGSAAGAEPPPLSEPEGWGDRSGAVWSDERAPGAAPPGLPDDLDLSDLGLDQDDPFGLRGGQGPAGAEPRHAGDGDLTEPVERDPLDEFLPDDLGQPQETQPDHASILNQAMPAPRLAEPLLPDDWDLEPPGPERAEEPPGPVAPMPPPRPVPPAAPQPSAGPASADAGLSAFLRGAGIEAAEFSGGGPPEAGLELAGRLFRELVQGLREVLQARAALKNEFRVERTVLRAVENNPVKFSVDVEDAMRALLRPKGQAYMPPPQAVAEAFRDVKLHELAVLAAMQAAMTALLSQLDPAVLARRVESDSGLLRLAAGRRARLWEAFEQRYREIARDAENNFRGVLGEEFSRAYEEYTRRAGR